MPNTLDHTPGPLLDAIYKAVAIHANARHRLEDLRLYLTEEYQQALIAEDGTTLDMLPVIWRTKPGAEDGDWSLYYRDPTSHELRHGISGNMPGPAPAPEVRIQIPTRAEYEAEAPIGSWTWEDFIGELVAAAMGTSDRGLPEGWGVPQVCEAHPHLPFPHGSDHRVPRAGCSGPGMPAPCQLTPGQPVPTRIVLHVVGMGGTRA